MKNFLINFLLEASDTFDWITSDGKSYKVDNNFYFVKQICDALNTLLWPLLIIVASAGSIFAIFLGVNMARAEDTSKRDEARKRIIGTIIAMAVVIVTILLIQLVFIPNIGGWLGVGEGE